jgi:chromosome segregation ATPase
LGISFSPGRSLTSPPQIDPRRKPECRRSVIVKGEKILTADFTEVGEMKRTKVIIAVIALSIAAGLFGGYRIWGTKDQGGGDIKQLLRNLEEEVGRIEQKNKDLVASIEASKGDIEASETVRKENQELKDELQRTLQEKQGLESSLAERKAKETDAIKQAEGEQEFRKVQDELKNKIATLESGNQDLADRLQQAEQKIAEKEGLLAEVRNELAEAHEKASKGEECKLLTHDLNARISELEMENKELRSVIDNISEMTQRKQETR